MTDLPAWNSALSLHVHEANLDATDLPGLKFVKSHATNQQQKGMFGITTGQCMIGSVTASGCCFDIIRGLPLLYLQAPPAHMQVCQFAQALPPLADP